MSLTVPQYKSQYSRQIVVEIARCLEKNKDYFIKYREYRKYTHRKDEFEKPEVILDGLDLAAYFLKEVKKNTKEDSARRFVPRAQVIKDLNVIAVYGAMWINSQETKDKVIVIWKETVGALPGAREKFYAAKHMLETLDRLAPSNPDPKLKETATFILLNEFENLPKKKPPHSSTNPFAEYYQNDALRMMVSEYAKPYASFLKEKRIPGRAVSEMAASFPRFNASTLKT